MKRKYRLDQPAVNPRLWPLDPQVTFLNHGSFGSCPKKVLARQQQLRDRLEREPVDYFVRELEQLLDEALTVLARFVGAKPEHMVFVANATAGVNTVLRSLNFQPGDELLVTDHEYNACRNALNFVAERARARVVVAHIPFPIKSPEAVLEPILSRVTSRTRLALIDQVTSQTGLVFPVRKLIGELSNRGVETLIDGAHAPGMIPLRLDTLGATYYTGNCHKWLCAPKVAGFLWVAPERRQAIRPLAISHGANSPRTDRSRLEIEFGWTGTWDPTPMLCVPESIRYLESLLPGGWADVRDRNRQLVLAARTVLCERLGIPAPCPASMIGSLAAIPIADTADLTPPKTPLYLDALQERLRMDYRIEVPVIPWPRAPHRLVRISAQLYNSLPQYEALADALQKEL